jgi:hypothetical protein
MGAAPLDAKGRPLADRTASGMAKAKEIQAWIAQNQAERGDKSAAAAVGMQEALINKQFGDGAYNTWKAFKDLPSSATAPDATDAMVAGANKGGLGLGRRLLRGRAESFVSGRPATASTSMGKTYLGS